MGTPAVGMEAFLAQVVRDAVAEAVAPLLAELGKLRRAQEAEGVSLQEAARRLHVSTKTVQRRIRAGELATVPGLRPVRVLLAGVLTDGP